MTFFSSYRGRFLKKQISVTDEKIDIPSRKGKKTVKKHVFFHFVFAKKQHTRVKKFTYENIMKNMLKNGTSAIYGVSYSIE